MARIKFVLTGSSARKLKKDGTNLLAGRALTTFMHPLTAAELKEEVQGLQSLRDILSPPLLTPQ